MANFGEIREKHRKSIQKDLRNYSGSTNTFGQYQENIWKAPEKYKEVLKMYWYTIGFEIEHYQESIKKGLRKYQVRTTKSCIRETLNLSTCGDSRADTKKKSGVITCVSCRHSWKCVTLLKLMTEINFFIIINHVFLDNFCWRTLNCHKI